ncbi:MAG TPA: peptidoglycan DD-metalloendopeptidase family protein [Pseudohongiella sp.]|nr:peptidoglycan DD-metalloendopeptidase family protein [Pseudohongiella sp.]
MKGSNSQHQILRTLPFAVLAVSVAACSSNYQAPIEDRSSTLERTAPMIIVDGQTVSGGGAIASSTSSAPAAAVNTAPVGAASTVVVPVSVNTGITRSVIRSPIPADSTPPASAPAASAPVTSTPAVQAPATQAPAASAPVSSSTAGRAAPAASGGVHVVAQGETLYSIAFAHNMDVRSLALANNLNAPYTIYPGQRLNLSAGNVSEAAISAVPQIPAAPAGEAAPTTGQRPQASVEARRTGSIPTRTVDGVTWQWPSDGRLLSTFSENGPTRGIDIAGSQGQPVFAAADGDVVYAGRGIQGAGNLVILRHSARYLSAYMYNSTMLVKEGDNVRAGDKIAEVGTGPNGRELLHFEVRVDGKPVDPVRYLPNR